MYDEIIERIEKLKSQNYGVWIYDEYTLGWNDAVQRVLEIIQEHDEELAVKRMEIIMRNGNSGEHYKEE
jgi:hypothetical protein